MNPSKFVGVFIFLKLLYLIIVKKVSAFVNYNEISEYYLTLLILKFIIKVKILTHNFIYVNILINHIRIIVKNLVEV